MFLPTEPAGPTRRRSPSAARAAFKIVLAGAGTAVAACLLWLAATTHLQRACVLRDSPYLPVCPQALPESDPAHETELRDRLRNNPGDSTAWVALANLPQNQSEDALLNALAVLAPSDSNALRLRAKKALAEDQMSLATDLLVKLTEQRVAGDEPPQLLARLLADGEGGMALLRPHLTAGSHWVPSVLASIVALKLPLEVGTPLLAEAAAKDLVPPAAVRSYIRSLKAAGKWADAYGLWVAQQRPPVPTLFNGGFGQKLQPDGFDWEVTPVAPSRAGALVGQRNLAGHGPALEIQFTGRAVTMPVIRQYLFIAPGRYLLKGQYMISKLRAEEGLAWVVRCTDPSSSLIGRSSPLQDTEAVWQDFQFEFSVPNGCGMVASLQLETFAPFEAAVGFTGKSSFDSFELQPLNP